MRSRRAVQAIAARSGRKGQNWTAYDVRAILKHPYGMADTVELLRG